MYVRQRKYVEWQVLLFWLVLPDPLLLFYVPVENRELTRSKLRCMAIEKRETVLKSDLIFNHLILYRISVWLVSFLFFLKKNQFLEDMTSLSLSLQQSTIEIMAECPIKNSRQSKSSELPVSSHLKIDTNVFLRDKE